MISTFHTYPDLVTLTSERLAETRWQHWHSVTLADGVLATLKEQPEAIILRATSSGFSDVAVGFMPGGLAA